MDFPEKTPFPKDPFLGDHQPYTATTKDFGSKKGFQRGWCTNCQNLREKQNVCHHQGCTGDVQEGFCGGGARIVGLDPFSGPENCRFLSLVMVERVLSQGFSNVPWHKRAFWPGTKYFFFTKLWANSWGLVYGEGGAPGATPLHNRRVTSHVLHQEVPLGWCRVCFVCIIFGHS